MDSRTRSILIFIVIAALCAAVAIPSFAAADDYDPTERYVPYTLTPRQMAALISISSVTATYTYVDGSGVIREQDMPALSFRTYEYDGRSFIGFNFTKPSGFASSTLTSVQINLPFALERVDLFQAYGLIYADRRNDDYVNGYAVNATFRNSSVLVSTYGADASFIASDYSYGLDGNRTSTNADFRYYGALSAPLSVATNDPYSSVTNISASFFRKSGADAGSLGTISQGTVLIPCITILRNTGAQDVVDSLDALGSKIDDLQESLNNPTPEAQAFIDSVNEQQRADVDAYGAAESSASVDLDVGGIGSSVDGGINAYTVVFGSASAYASVVRDIAGLPTVLAVSSMTAFLMVVSYLLFGKKV